MIIMYTCKVCATRSVRKISKHSYQRGGVVVKWACCNNMHLITSISSCPSTGCRLPPPPQVAIKEILPLTVVTVTVVVVAVVVVVASI